MISEDPSPPTPLPGRERGARAFIFHFGSLYIVLTTPNGEYFKNNLPRFSDCPDPSQYEAIQFQPNSDGHIFLLHVDEIENITHKAGLILDEIRLVTNPLTNGHIKLHYLLRILPKSLVEAIEKLTSSIPLEIKRKFHTTTIALLSNSSADQRINREKL